MKKSLYRYWILYHQALTRFTPGVQYPGGKDMKKIILLLHVFMLHAMKWTSVLFSDLRKKLGNQIVGTSWKGRGVFRKYVIPANPRTCAQTANRDHHKKIVAFYQANVGGDNAKKAMWDTDALPRSISGFNLFQKLGMSSRVSCDEVSNSPDPIMGLYTVKTDISSAGLYMYNESAPAWEEVVAVGEMSDVPDTPFEIIPDPDLVGPYYFYIVDARSKTIPPTSEDSEALVNNWSLDSVTNCEAVPAKNDRSAE